MDGGLVGGGTDNPKDCARPTWCTACIGNIGDTGLGEDMWDKMMSYIEGQRVAGAASERRSCVTDIHECGLNALVSVVGQVD